MINSTLPIPKPRMSEFEEPTFIEGQSETLPKKAVPQGEAMKCFCRIRPSDLKNGMIALIKKSSKSLTIQKTKFYQ